MLRSILVALDESPASSEARRLAIDLRKRLDAQITSLAISDRDHITSLTAVGIGGMAYKYHRDLVKLEEAKSFLQRLEKGFQQSCEAIGTAWRVFAKHGYHATSHGIGSEPEPAEIMLTEAEAPGATLIAMGASGHTRCTTSS